MKTHGVIDYDASKRTFVIQTEPHVSLRLKRVFAKIDKNRLGVHRISATPENAYDLRWFVRRYAHHVVCLDVLKALAKEHEDRMSIVDAMRAGTLAAPEIQLAVPIREYQRQAAAIALRLGGILLADSVGLGKTVSSIATFTDPRVLPAVVVCYPALCMQWVREINRFAPALRTHVLKTGAPYDLQDAGRGKRVEMPHVILASFHKLSGWASTLKALPVRSVVIDEAQELRAGKGTAKYEAAFHLVTSPDVRMRLLNSATPIHNLGSEFFNVIECVRPNALGTRAEFMREWCGDAEPDEDGVTFSRAGSSKSRPLKDPKAFGVYLRSEGLMLQRTREDVGRELPPCQHILHTVDADHRELDRVAPKCAELARLILSKADADMNAEEARARMTASAELSMLLRLVTGVAKAPHVAAFVQMLVESGEKVVVFGWHRKVYDILLEALKQFAPRLYTGTETAKQKDEAKQAFVDGKTPILIISNRAGAGLDGLQFVSRTCVHAELDWSPAVREQNTGRIFRDGQPHPVTSYTLVTESGSDPVIADLLGLKQQQLDGVRHPTAALVEKLEVDPHHIRKLAEAYLAQQRGRPKIKDYTREGAEEDAHA